MYEISDNLAICSEQSTNRKITTVVYDITQPPSVESIKSVTIVNPSRIHQLRSIYAVADHGPLALLIAIDRSSRKGLIPDPNKVFTEKQHGFWRVLHEGEGNSWVETTFNMHPTNLEPWVNAKYKATCVIPNKNEAEERSSIISPHDLKELFQISLGLCE